MSSPSSGTTDGPGVDFTPISVGTELLLVGSNITVVENPSISPIVDRKLPVKVSVSILLDSINGVIDIVELGLGPG